MSNKGSEFPVFIKAQYDPGNAKNQFVADVDEMLATADRRAGRFGERMQQRLDAAFKAPRTASGGLDIDVEGAQRAATAQSARAVAAREIAEALGRAALAENDHSLAMKQSLRAAQDLATKEEQRAADLGAQARISALTQAELNKQTSAVEMLTAATGRQNAANDNLGGGMRAQRAAMVNAGQQLQDMAVQYQMGTKASTIMAQQLPQLSFALSGLAGNANKSLAAIGGAASFMAGPWGAAIMAATVVLGPLIGRLFDTADAAEKVKFASSAMGDAQGILGGVLDMTTGRINNQSTALRALAEAQLLVARVEATTRAAEARRGVAAIQNRPLEFIGNGFGGGIGLQRRQVDARDTISQQVLDGTISGKLAVERLDNLRKVGVLTDEQFAAAATSVANLGVELENIGVYDKAEKLLNGRGGRDLLKRDTGGSRKRDGGGESEAEKSRKLAEQQAEAVRKVGDEQARAVELAQLAAQGREDEAADLQLAWRLMDALNVKDRAGLETALERVGVRREEYEAMRGNLRTLREIEEASRAAQERMALYLDATRSARQEVVAIFSGNGSFAGFNNLFKQVRGEYLTRQIFGDAFDGLERWLQDQSGLGRSVDYMAANTSRAGDEAKSFAADLSAARLAITGKPATAGSTAFEAAFAPLFGTDTGGALVKSSSETTDEIRVLGRKTDKLANNLKPEEWARELSDSMAKALGRAAPELFGGQAAQGILGGAMYGNMIGGAPGAILGGIGGIPGIGSGLANLASMGLQGLGVAGMINAVAASFGVKIPNAVNYGLLTGLGGIFHSAKYGNASFQGGVLNVNGNNADMKESATTFGDGLLSTLNQIADQLDASLGAFNVSLGQTDGKWRISTTGRTGELKSKYSDVQVFGKGDEAYQQALQAAIRDAISDGAITGIGQAAQNILRAGGDLQKAIEKAALVQSIPRQLKQLTDPVGFAIDELNRDFSKVVDALKLGSASAAEFADAEKLYTLKRAEAVKQASEALTGSLRSLFEELTIGNNSLSLRDRESAAMAKYGALADRVRAGDTTAYSDYADAARVMLDIERQIHGSQEAYFAALGNVTSLTRSTLDAQQALIDAASSSANPFSANAISANDNQGVIDGLAAIEAGVLATNQNLGIIISQLAGGGETFGNLALAPSYY